MVDSVTLTSKWPPRCATRLGTWMRGNYGGVSKFLNLLPKEYDYLSDSLSWAPDCAHVPNKYQPAPILAEKRVDKSADFYLLFKEKLLTHLPECEAGFEIFVMGDSTALGVKDALERQFAYLREDDGEIPEFHLHVDYERGRAIRDYVDMIFDRLAMHANIGIVVLMGIIDFLRIYVESIKTEDWMFYSETYLAFMELVFRELSDRGILTVMLGPFIVDTGPQRNLSDYLGESLVIYMDEHLADLCANSDILYVSTLQCFRDRIEDLKGGVSAYHPHYAVINGIHLSPDGNNVIAIKLLQAILEQIQAQWDF